MPRPTRYDKVRDYRGWTIWKARGQNLHVANMKLEMEVRDVDEPDLIAGIDESMISNLGAFQARIVGGAKPRS